LRLTVDAIQQKVGMEFFLSFRIVFFHKSPPVRIDSPLHYVPVPFVVALYRRCGDFDGKPFLFRRDLPPLTEFF
jgi:hypothetical protein